MSTMWREKMLKREAKSQNHNGLPTKVISIHHPFHFYLLSSPPLFLFLFTLCALLISVPHPLRGFLGSADVQESACSAGDPVSIPGSGRSSGEGIGNPLQYSWASLVAQLIKKIYLQCGRLGFDPWVGKILWRREQLPTPVFWPGESHGLYSP